MPTFNDPTADSAEARQALRGLAHATLRIDDPDKLYGIVGELLGATRSLEQSLIQLGGASLTHQDRAAHDDGDLGLGAADTWAAADALRQAAGHVSAAETVLDQASGHLGRIAWQRPQNTGPAQDPANAEAARRALYERRNRVRGDESWFTPDRIADIKRDRGLGR